MDTSNSWHKVNRADTSGAWCAPQEDASAFLAGSKRLMDLALASVALAVLGPVLALIAAAIKLESAGPVLFRSKRIGKGGRTFECIKFRTMDSNEETRVGAWLRRFGLDELPQLVNVVRGEMSIVGPRPVMASERGEMDVRHMRRFRVRPGMTGMWPVQGRRYPGLRGNMSTEAAYREGWSPWMDLAIMARSVGAALAGR
jgi:lipopolysaccharide/colanic/teichoic acid biosynthesis glycosyltransferase